MPRKQQAVATKKIVEFVVDVLDDFKIEELTCLDVRHLTSITDVMIIGSGRSDRHVRAAADNLIEKCKEFGYTPLGIEGQESGEWVLVDLADVIVHLMLPRTREFYDLEKLWDIARPQGKAVE